jgi:putative MATE family efflux protein
MVGQLGETAVAAVGLAGQLAFLLNLMVFGISSGAAMFSAQLWGKNDIPNIKKVLGLALILSLSSSLLFVIISEFFPTAALNVYTNDPAVIAMGSHYLRIFGLSFIFGSITATFSLILRSVGQVRVPMFVSVSALLLNIILNYILIFGKFGLPALGVYGAAWGTLISRILECVAIVVLTYIRKLPPAGSLFELLSFNAIFARLVLKPVLPVVLNEILWSFGVTAYQAIYAHIGTDQVAAINIAAAIADMAFVVFMGIGNACAIMVGHQIGGGEVEKAQLTGGRTISLGLIGGVIVGFLVWVICPVILDLYKVAPLVILFTRQILLVTCSLLWLRMMNFILFIGVFRPGGDTRFALLLDGIIIWVVGVPLTAAGAFIFGLPIQLVYLLTFSEELCKWALGLWRYFSKRWIHNLAETVTPSI